MISHLNIKANGKDLVIPEDFSLEIEDANPLFNENEMYTFPVSIPMDGNRHLVKDMDAVHSDVKPSEVEHTKMLITVDGVPYRSGVAVVEEAQELDDHLSFSIQSMRESLEDKISDLDCRDIPVKDKIQIGEMIGDVRVEFNENHRIFVTFKEVFKGKDPGWVLNPYYDGTNVIRHEHFFSLQALGFSYPFVALERSDHHALKTVHGVLKSKNFINVTNGYSPSTPYCNTRVCYKGMKLTDKKEISDAADLDTPYPPYTVLEADRPQSGINFYVLYFLDCLFHFLKVSYDGSNLQKVEDMKHLFFFNTACKFYTEPKISKTEGYEGVYDLNSLEEINDWVSSRAEDPAHCGKLEIYAPWDKTQHALPTKDDISSITINGETFNLNVPVVNPVLVPMDRKHHDVLTMTKCKSSLIHHDYSVCANILNMYANADNFPNESVSSVLDSLKNSFGIRFLADAHTNSVRAVFLRDIYRDTSAPIDFPCNIVSVHKIVEKCTGVRMKYSVESDAKEQRHNVKYGVKDYDTNFDYIDYAKVDSSLDYAQIIQKHSSFDMTTYVDKNTGNAYRLKVDSEARTVSEFNARLFEVGGYKGVEYGDCSSINEDFVEDITIGWSPMLFTDVNIKHEMKIGNNREEIYDISGSGQVKISFSNAASREQIFAAYLDEEMVERNGIFNIDNQLPIDTIDVYLREVMTTDESYDPESTDDGNSPLQHADWGCAVGLMRGGGSDMTLQNYDYNYDGFGNSKWRFVAGTYDCNADSIDNWGNNYDYDSSAVEGLGGEQFSLKIRAYKNDPVTGKPMVNPDPKDIKNRGLFDTFMSEHAHFLLNRKKYKIVCECEIAALADIPNHWDKRFRIGELVGWINKISSSVSAREGLGLVEIEMYSL